MVDDEKHKITSKRDRKDYMREYMRERRKRTQPQPAPDPQDLHGPVAPPNLPRTGTPKKILQAHYAHVLNLWAETGQELARITDTDEMVNTLESLMLENKNLKVENENLREALKTRPGENLSPKTQEPPKAQESQLATDLQPSNLQPSNLQRSKPPEPGLVDPDRRPSPADDTPADWML